MTEPTRILDEDGAVLPDATVPDLTDDQLLDIYRDMKTGRRFDERAISLQRRGEMATYSPSAGQEGAHAGSAHALDEDDWVVPSYRDRTATMAHGLELSQNLLYRKGFEEGNRVPEGVNVFPMALPIATQIPHATGSAWASKRKGEDSVTLCYFGDGATSEGDFHEGLNFAGAFDVPAVFFCNNNQWAISLPREEQTASDSLAQKATAYGFEGVQVDGMDPLAVYQVTKEAVEKAKNPGEDELRPTMIEAVQYRFGAHTTADDPTVYRDEEEVEEWKGKDPIPRFETFLRDRGLLDDERVEAIEAEAEEYIDEMLEEALERSDVNPDDMFDNVFAEATPRLEEQRAWLHELREEYGDEAIQEED